MKQKQKMDQGLILLKIISGKKILHNKTSIAFKNL